MYADRVQDLNSLLLLVHLWVLFDTVASGRPFVKISLLILTLLWKFHVLIGIGWVRPSAFDPASHFDIPPFLLPTLDTLCTLAVPNSTFIGIAVHNATTSEGTGYIMDFAGAVRQVSESFVPPLHPFQLTSQGCYWAFGNYIADCRLGQFLQLRDVLPHLEAYIFHRWYLSWQEVFCI